VEAGADRRFCCYGCRLLGERPPTDPSDRVDDPSRGRVLFRIVLGAVVASQAMLLGFALNLSEPEGTVRHGLHGLLITLTLGVLWLLGPPLLRAAWDCACRRTLGLELLFVSGVLGAFGASLQSTLRGSGPVYYEVVAVLLTVYSAGKALTARAREQALSETRRLDETFATALRVGPPDVRVSVRDIVTGDLVRVLPGEPIPVDGVVVRGEGFVRETPLTGEPEPVVRRLGDPVMAGGFSEDAELVVRSRGSGRTRGLDELIRRVGEARATLGTSQAQAQADRLARVFLPVVITTAVGAFLWAGLRGDWAEGLFHGLSVLLVACPCALGLATPLGLWQGMATLAARGLVVRDARALERLASVTLAAFDKTGTLSESRLSLVDLVTRGDAADRHRWLTILAAVQARSHHPIARAFQGRVAGNDPEAGARRVEAFEVVPGQGVQAIVFLQSGPPMTVRIGRRDWAWASGADPGLEDRLQGPGSRVWASADGIPVAVGQVQERLRSSVASTLEDLEQLGIPARVLSGDRMDRVREVVAGVAGLADAVDDDGARRIDGGLGPLDKAEQVRRWQAAGQRVLFVGDGINDAAALAEAHVGIGLLEGAPLAVASAEVVLCGGDLREIPAAVAVARRVRDSIEANLRFAVAYNGLGMVLAATGHLHPVVAALLMSGSSAVVAWRAWRGGSCHPDERPRNAASRAVAGMDRPEQGLPARIRPVTPWIIPAGLVLQVPWLIGLGNLGPRASGVVASLALLTAWASTRAETMNPTHDRKLPASGSPDRPTRWAPMVWGMLGPANLAMLVGWWADAGFGPVMREGVCLCCSGHRYFGFGAGVPWMTLAMVAAGLPFMRGAITAWTGPWTRLAVAVALAVSMAGGMDWGATRALRWAGPGHPGQFLIAYAGMTAGMMAGMLFACGVLDALRRRAR
jgi:heavy metal translocating P-type ATPase